MIMLRISWLVRDVESVVVEGWLKMLPLTNGSRPSLNEIVKQRSCKAHQSRRLHGFHIVTELPIVSFAADFEFSVGALGQRAIDTAVKASKHNNLRRE